MKYRTLYLAIALILGLLLALGMGVLEKHRYAAQTVASPSTKVERAGIASGKSLATPAAEVQAVSQAEPAAEAQSAGKPDLTAEHAIRAAEADDLGSTSASELPDAPATASEPTTADPDIDALVEGLNPTPPEYLAQLSDGGADSRDAAGAEGAISKLHVVEKPVPEPELYWYDDYADAWAEAKEDGRLLFVYFFDSQPSATRRSFEAQTLARPDIKAKLAEFVLLKLSVDGKISSGGRSLTLLRHPAFAEMLGRQGIAIIDLAHRKAEYYEHVVSTFPFVRGKYYRGPAVDAILSLPPGSLTQRTMIYAVRTHPEAPASTQGKFHNVLAEEAKLQSDYQANILVQGHQNWENRFHRINARLQGATAEEVVAESWPNESLVDACVDCVDSWRQSPGHWNKVRSRHPLFGFDIKRGRNGIWYATGIFGRR